MMQRTFTLAESIRYGVTMRARPGAIPWQSHVRSSTPLFILITWLVVGTFIFYVVESPAETERHLALQRAINAKQAAAAAAATDDPRNRFSVDVSQHKLQFDTNGESLESPQELIQLIREFNKFFSNPKESGIDVVALRASRGVDGRMTIGVYYTNATVETIPGAVKDIQQLTAEKVGNLKWNLPGSLFFCIAVVTTIGYGNLAPTTNMGKFLCVVYALIGIPLFLIVVEQIRRTLIQLASRLHKVSYSLAQFCQRRSTTIVEQNQTVNSIMTMLQQKRDSIRRGSRITRSPSATERHEAEMERLLMRTKLRAATGLVTISLCAIFIFVPSIFFVYAEGWDYLSALYFCLISLTTIGFGDLIAGQQSGGQNEDNEFLYGIYRVFLSIWLFFGIAFVATLINVMQTLIERIILKFQLCTSRSKESNDEGNEENGKPNDLNVLDIIDRDLLGTVQKIHDRDPEANKRSKSMSDAPSKPPAPPQPTTVTHPTVHQPPIATVDYSIKSARV